VPPTFLSAAVDGSAQTGRESQLLHNQRGFVVDENRTRSEFLKVFESLVEQEASSACHIQAAETRER